MTPPYAALSLLLSTQDATKLLEEKSALLDEYFMVNFSRRGGAAAGAVGGGTSGAGKGTGGAGASSSVDAAAERRGGEGEQAALCISSLPLLLEGHSPVAEGLPTFLLRLAMEVGPCVAVAAGVVGAAAAAAARGVEIVRNPP